MSSSSETMTTVHQITPDKIKQLRDGFQLLNVSDSILAVFDNKPFDINQIITGNSSNYFNVPNVNHHSDSNTFTLLHLAAYLGSKVLVSDLIALGADANAYDNTGASPIHVAYTNNHYDLVKSMLEIREVDPNKHTHKSKEWCYLSGYTENTLINRAVCDGNFEFFQMLFSHSRINPKITDKNNQRDVFSWVVDMSGRIVLRPTLYSNEYLDGLFRIFNLIKKDDRFSISDYQSEDGRYYGKRGDLEGLYRLGFERMQATSPSEYALIIALKQYKEKGTAIEKEAVDSIINSVIEIKKLADEDIPAAARRGHLSSMIDVYLTKKPTDPGDYLVDRRRVDQHLCIFKAPPPSEKIQKRMEETSDRMFGL